MKPKSAIASLAFFFAAGLLAQTPVTEHLAQLPSGESAIGPVPIPLGPDDALKVRNLEHQQDALLLEIERLKLQIMADEKSSADFARQINDEAYAAAAKQKVDTTKFVLDLDQLAWVKKGSPQ